MIVNKEQEVEFWLKIDFLLVMHD